MVGELHRVASELETVGYTLTDFEKLGLHFDSALAQDLNARVNGSDGSAAALEVVKHIDKADMTIVQDATCLDIGRQLVGPLVEALFVDNPDAVENWTLFGMNRYKVGGRFGAHRDDVNASVLVVTASGRREFEVYQTESDATQADLTTVEATFELYPGSIMILDAHKDPGHAVTRTIEPSVTAVADVAYVLRPNPDGSIRSIAMPPRPVVAS